MILVLSNNVELGASLSALLASHGLACTVTRPHLKAALAHLYQPEVVAAVVDSKLAGMPEHAWHDLLANLGKRIPLIVVGQTASGGPRLAGVVSWLKDPSAESIVALLDACGAIGIDHRRIEREKVPLYNPQIPLHMLQSNGALSLLLVDASSFRKIAIEYGNEVYSRVQDCFNAMLFEMWGSQGAFRSADFLCRRSASSNSFYVFLEQSRTASAVPAPGILERLADRLAVKLINAFWREIFLDRSKRIMPDCISFVPDIAVGFATAVYNPCVDSLEAIEQLLDTAMEESRLQLKRMRDRQRELMQTLIQTPGLLRPSYQAVFHLPGLSKSLVDAAHSTASIRPLMPLLFGFESLIRVRGEAMENVFDPQGPTYLEARFLRPDVLFNLSHAAKVGLELDQACLHQAVVNSAELPGTLLVNILPRNLYNIERLRHLIMDRRDIMFEVSETEAINNFDLMLKVRDIIGRMDMRIATDDFGRGYSGLEQVIKLRPDLIKLDRSLIQDIHIDRPKQAFVSGLVRATKINDSTILAEGVERWEEAEVLQAMGIDLIQGFLLHRPQPAEQILEHIGQEPVLQLGTVA